jgi:hypothetical protein
MASSRVVDDDGPGEAPLGKIPEMSARGANPHGHLSDGYMNETLVTEVQTIGTAKAPGSVTIRQP